MWYKGLILQLFWELSWFFRIFIFTNATTNELQTATYCSTTTTIRLSYHKLLSSSSIRNFTAVGNYVVDTIKLLNK